jgi:hypothetical protein
MAHFFVLVLNVEETAKSVEVRERFDYCFEIIRKENNKDRKGKFFFLYIYLLFFTLAR